MSKVGNGDIGSILPDRVDLLFFASGVSNSRCTDEAEYQRERELLLKQQQAAHIVYFSSIGVFDQDSRYYRHKRDMELAIKSNFPNHCIIRLGNISWGSNPNTLINYLKTHPDAEIQDVYRHVIDKAEFLYWISRIPEFSCEMMLPGRKLKVKEIVAQYAGL